VAAEAGAAAHQEVAAAGQLSPEGCQVADVPLDGAELVIEVAELAAYGVGSPVDVVPAGRVGVAVEADEPGALEVVERAGLGA
jgi:hypothetical protein